MEIGNNVHDNQQQELSQMITMVELTKTLKTIAADKASSPDVNFKDLSRRQGYESEV